MRSALRGTGAGIVAGLIIVAVLVPAAVAKPAAELTISITPVRPYQPGDKVWWTTPPVGPTTRSLCERVPSSGYIGQGVFASSAAHFSTSWNWSAASSGQPFTWYLKRPDESNADWGSSGGGGGSTSASANTYHWKVQNNGSTPQAWTVCYS